MKNMVVIPKNNPYWNRDLGQVLEIEQREKLLKILRPTKEDWEMLHLTKEITKSLRKSK